MFTIFVIKQNPGTVYITTPDYFSQFLLDMKITQEDILWDNVSLEHLMTLKDNQANYIVLTLQNTG